MCGLVRIAACSSYAPAVTPRLRACSVASMQPPAVPQPAPAASPPPKAAPRPGGAHHAHGTTCHNCGAALHGPWCAVCGQKDQALDPSFHDLVHEVTHESLHLDGKIFGTLRALLRPGQLTLDFLAGRRARYIGPLRLYLTCSVLYFVVAALFPQPPEASDPKGWRAVQVGLVRIDGGAGPEELERDAAKATGVEKMWLTHLARAQRNPERLQHAAESAVPKAMFVLVPGFALILQLVYRRRRMRFPRHLYFALHLHAFAFLALLLPLLLRFAEDSLAPGLVGLIVTLLLGRYLYVALRRVYGGRRGPLLARCAVLVTAYATLLSAGMLATFGLLVLSF
jgi:hypothetical protein